MQPFVKTGLAAVLAVAPVALQAQVLRDCDTFEANARNLMMPPEVSVRSFADGAIRLIALETIEPACCYAHLMVTYPIPDEPYPGCTLISDEGARGFSGLLMEDLSARYDPAVGLTISVPAGAFHADADTTYAPLNVVVNQATGVVRATR